MRTRIRHIASGVLALLLAGCAGLPDSAPSSTSPTLDAMATAGAHARSMIPSYPTLTFPNHYSFVTGLRPGHHGVIRNRMRDARDFRRGIELAPFDNVDVYPLLARRLG